MSPTRSTPRWRRSNAPEHQQRRPRRQPDAGSGAAHTPSGTAVCDAPRRRPRPRRKDEARSWTTSRTTSTSPSGAPSGERRPVPRQGPAGRRRGQADLARVGRPGGSKRQSVEIVADNVQFLGSRDGGGGGGGKQFVPQGAGAVHDRRLPRGGGRRRHSVLGEQWRSRKHSRRGSVRLLAGPRPAQELPLLQGQDRRGRLQEPEPAPPLHLGEGEDPQPRISGACRRHQRQVAVAVKRAREMALLPYVEERWRWRILLRDVDKVGLRGEVVNVARGYARNFLLPRGLAEPATPGRVAELGRLEDQRARNEAARSSRRSRSPTCSRRPAQLRRQGRPDRCALRLGDDDDIADELWRTRKIRVDRKKIEPDAIKRIALYAVPVQVFADVRAELRTRRPRRWRASARGEAELRWRPPRPRRRRAIEAEAEAHRAEAAAELEATLEAEDEPEVDAEDTRTPAEAAGRRAVRREPGRPRLWRSRRARAGRARAAESEVATPEPELGPGPELESRRESSTARSTGLWSALWRLPALSGHDCCRQGVACRSPGPSRSPPTGPSFCLPDLAFDFPQRL